MKGKEIHLSLCAVCVPCVDSTCVLGERERECQRDKGKEKERTKRRGKREKIFSREKEITRPKETC